MSYLVAYSWCRLKKNSYIRPDKPLTLRSPGISFLLWLLPLTKIHEIKRSWNKIYMQKIETVQPICHYEKLKQIAHIWFMIIRKGYFLFTFRKSQGGNPVVLRCVFGWARQICTSDSSYPRPFGDCSLRNNVPIIQVLVKPSLSTCLLHITCPQSQMRSVRGVVAPYSLDRNQTCFTPAS